MIKQILIEDGGLTYSYKKAKEKAKKLCKETGEIITVITSPQLVYDRYIDKPYGIYALCNKCDDHEINRIKLFLENFAIDYQHKLLERNFPEILQYCDKDGEYIL